MLACHVANEDTVQFSMTSERSHYVSLSRSKRRYDAIFDDLGEVTLC